MTALTVVLVRLAAPVTAICGTRIAGFFGGGLIHLPTKGGWYLASLLVLVLAVDLHRYAMHRLSHAVPFLWAMHSFHHSAEAISFLTGARHHWVEQVMNNGFPADAGHHIRLSSRHGSHRQYCFFPTGWLLASEPAVSHGAGGHMDQQSAMAPHPPFRAAGAPKQKLRSVAAPVGPCIWDRLDSGS